MKKIKKCVVCGAKVRNQNPKTITCSPECTAKKNHEEAPDPKFKTCPGCGIAILNWEDDCGFCTNQESFLETETYR
jgi:predicted nucleic acid-binding Zn ribbon protein